MEVYQNLPIFETMPLSIQTPDTYRMQVYLLYEVLRTNMTTKEIGTVKKSKGTITETETQPRLLRNDYFK